MMRLKSALRGRASWGIGGVLASLGVAAFYGCGGDDDVSGASRNVEMGSLPADRVLLVPPTQAKEFPVGTFKDDGTDGQLVAIREGSDSPVASVVVRQSGKPDVVLAKGIYTSMQAYRAEKFRMVCGVEFTAIPRGEIPTGKVFQYPTATEIGQSNGALKPAQLKCWTSPDSAPNRWDPITITTGDAANSNVDWNEQLAEDDAYGGADGTSSSSGGDAYGGAIDQAGYRIAPQSASNPFRVQPTQWAGGDMYYGGNGETVNGRFFTWPERAASLSLIGTTPYQATSDKVDLANFDAKKNQLTPEQAASIRANGVMVAFQRDSKYDPGWQATEGRSPTDGHEWVAITLGAGDKPVASAIEHLPFTGWADEKQGVANLSCQGACGWIDDGTANGMQCALVAGSDPTKGGCKSGQVCRRNRCINPAKATPDDACKNQTTACIADPETGRLPCGIQSDNCGGKIDCGLNTCRFPNTCGGAGLPRSCGTSLTQMNIVRARYEDQKTRKLCGIFRSSQGGFVDLSADNMFRFGRPCPNADESCVSNVCTKGGGTGGDGSDSGTGEMEPMPGGGGY